MGAPTLSHRGGVQPSIINPKLAVGDWKLERQASADEGLMVEISTFVIIYHSGSRNNTDAPTAAQDQTESRFHEEIRPTSK